MNRNSVSFEFSEISASAIASLQDLDFSATGTRRLCLHNSVDDLLHVMLVEILPETFFRYHEHRSDEFVLILRGSIQILEKGSSTRHLSANKVSGGIVSAGIVHAIKAGGEGALYLEVIRGPFIKSLKV